MAAPLKRAKKFISKGSLIVFTWSQLLGPTVELSSSSAPAVFPAICNRGKPCKALLLRLKVGGQGTLLRTCCYATQPNPCLLYLSGTEQIKLKMQISWVGRSTTTAPYDPQYQSPWVHKTWCSGDQTVSPLPLWVSSDFFSKFLRYLGRTFSIRIETKMFRSGRLLGQSS